MIGTGREATSNSPRDFRDEDSSFPSAGGERIFYRVDRPKGSPRATLVYIHGMGEHSGRYRHLTGPLVEAGVACWGLDLRGHGRSTGKRGVILSFDEYVEDLDRFRVVVREDGKGPAPCFALGHSMGSVILIEWLLRSGPHDLRGIIVSGGVMVLSARVVLSKKLAAPLLSRLLPRFTMANGIDPRGALFSDPEEVRSYETDPLVTHQVSARTYLELARCAEQANRAAHRITLPTLVVHGAQDPLGSAEGMRDWAARLGSADKRVIIYENSLHEVINDVERKRAIADIKGWILERA